MCGICGFCSASVVGEGVGDGKGCERASLEQAWKIKI